LKGKIEAYARKATMEEYNASTFGCLLNHDDLLVLWDSSNVRNLTAIMYPINFNLSDLRKLKFNYN